MSILQQVAGLFAVELEEFVIIAGMCLLAVVVVKAILQDTMLAVFFFPPLVISAILCVGIAKQYGFIGPWYRDTVPFLIASGMGMSLVAMVILFFVALANRA